MRVLAPLIAFCVFAPGQEPPKAHFHHIHLNATDPAAAIQFYTGKFDCEKGKFAGEIDAVRTQDISDLAGKPPGSFFFAYVDGPDHALIELNTASHHRFGHVHLLSEDPVAAGEWYKKHFGLTGYIGRQPRVYRGVHVEPLASLVMDNVNIIIFPVEYARDATPDLWKDRKTFESTKGRVVDHLAFGVEDPRETLARLQDDGAKVTEEVANTGAGKIRSAFIQGPDRIRIELVEGQAYKE